MVGWSPGCYIPSFVEIGLPVPEKKIFLRGFTIYGHGGHLDHVPASCHQICIALYLKAFIQNLVQIGTVASEKIRFQFFVCSRPWAKVKK